MDKKTFIGLLSSLFLLSVLFTYQGSKSTNWLLFFGIAFGITWFFMK